MRIILAMSVLLIAGCASLKSEILSKVHDGDSSDQIKALFGEPIAFQRSATDASITIWAYKRRADTCGIALKGDKVVGSECQTDASYRGPVSRFLSGMGDGLTEASKSNSIVDANRQFHNSYQQPVTCTKNGGSLTSYTCQ